MSRVEVIGDATLYLGDKKSVIRDVATCRACWFAWLLCRVCNAAHYLELKFGTLPFRIVWEGGNAV